MEIENHRWDSVYPVLPVKWSLCGAELCMSVCSFVYSFIY